MGACLVIEESKSVADIESVMKHPAIYDRITDDDCPPSEEWNLNESSGSFLVGYVDDRPIAVMAFHQDGEWFCHIQVIPEFREYADEFARRSLDWFFENMGLNVLFAKIPENYPNVIKFAQKFGFELDSMFPIKHIKNGVEYSQSLYLLERKAWVL